jgi:hypothetical protein
MRRGAGAALVTAIGSWLMAASLLLAGPASGDDVGAGDHSEHDTVLAEEPPGDATPEATTRSPPEPRWFLWFPWPSPDVDLEPGHDKCKRPRGFSMPQWCFVAKGWPLLKAQPGTAKVKGVRGAIASRK